MKGFSLYIIVCVFLLLISFLIYFFIGSLRFGVGTDFFDSYFNLFINEVFSKKQRDIEFGFGVLLRIIALFTNNPQWIFIITSFVFNVLVYYIIVRFTKHWALTGMLVMIIGIYFDAFNNVRQGIALAAGICGLLYSANRKYGRGVLFLLFAYLFHRTVLVFVPFYILAGIKPLKKFFYIFVILFFILTPFYLDIARLVLKGTPYIVYLNRGQTNVSIQNFLIIQIPIFTFTLLNYRDLSKKYECFFSIGIINTLAVIVSIFMLQTPTSFETMYRAYKWFSWTPLLIIPYMLDIDAPISIRLIYVITTTAIIISQNYIIYFVFYFNEIYPYHFYGSINHLNDYYTYKQPLLTNYCFANNCMKYS